MNNIERAKEIRNIIDNHDDESCLYDWMSLHGVDYFEELEQLDDYDERPKTLYEVINTSIFELQRFTYDDTGEFIGALVFLAPGLYIDSVNNCVYTWDDYRKKITFEYDDDDINQYIKMRAANKLEVTKR